MVIKKIGTKTFTFKQDKNKSSTNETDQEHVTRSSSLPEETKKMQQRMIFCYRRYQGPQKTLAQQLTMKGVISDYHST